MTRAVQGGLHAAAEETRHPVQEPVARVERGLPKQPAEGQARTSFIGGPGNSSSSSSSFVGSCNALSSSSSSSVFSCSARPSNNSSSRSSNDWRWWIGMGSAPRGRPELLERNVGVAAGQGPTGQGVHVSKREAGKGRVRSRHPDRARSVHGVAKSPGGQHRIRSRHPCGAWSVHGVAKSTGGQSRIRASPSGRGRSIHGVFTGGQGKVRTGQPRDWSVYDVANSKARQRGV